VCFDEEIRAGLADSKIFPENSRSNIPQRQHLQIPWVTTTCCWNMLKRYMLGGLRWSLVNDQVLQGVSRWGHTCEDCEAKPYNKNNPDQGLRGLFLVAVFDDPFVRSGMSCALKTKRPKESSKRWIRTSSKFLNIKLPFHWLPTWVIRSNTESVFQFLGDVIYSAKGWRTMRLASQSIPAHESRAQLIEVHTWTSHHDDSKFPHLDVAAITAAQRVWMKQLA
jgi:hypothetical protein